MQNLLEESWRRAISRSSICAKQNTHRLHTDCESDKRIERLGECKELCVTMHFQTSLKFKAIAENRSFLNVHREKHSLDHIPKLTLGLNNLDEVTWTK